jgi:hypothetical protein
MHAYASPAKPSTSPSESEEEEEEFDRSRRRWRIPAWSTPVQCAGLG